MKTPSNFVHVGDAFILAHCGCDESLAIKDAFGGNCFNSIPVWARDDYCQKCGLYKWHYSETPGL